MTTVGVVSANATALCLDPFPRAAGSAAALLGVVGMGVGALVSTTLVVVQMPVVLELGVAMVAGSILGLLALLWVASGARQRGEQGQGRSGEGREEPDADGLDNRVADHAE